MFGDAAAIAFMNAMTSSYRLVSAKLVASGRVCGQAFAAAGAAGFGAAGAWAAS